MFLPRLFFRPEERPRAVFRETPASFKSSGSPRVQILRQTKTVGRGAVYRQRPGRQSSIGLAAKESRNLQALVHHGLLGRLVGFPAP